MKKEPIDLSDVDEEALVRLCNEPTVLMRLEMKTSDLGFKAGTVTGVKARGPFRCRAQISYDAGDGAADLLVTRVAGTWTANSGFRKLVAWRTVQVPVETPEPVEPPQPSKPKDEFSDKGIMPSDHPGINEMLKKGFKEIFGGDMTGAKAPAKRTLPSSKALFMVASEKYMGLGFNDGLE